MSKLPMLKLDKLIQSRYVSSTGMLKSAGFHINYGYKGGTAEVYMPINGKEYTVEVSHPDPDIALQNAVFRVLAEAITIHTVPVQDTDMYQYVNDAELLDPADTHLLVPMLDAPESLWRAIAILITNKCANSC